MKEFWDSLVAKPEVANAIAAIAAVSISFISLLLALWAVAVQRRHNYYSVRPLAAIGRVDYEDRFFVKLHNNGVGPLIITKLSVSDGKTNKDNLLEWMPRLPYDMLWNSFSTELQGRSLAPGDEINLLELSGSLTDPHFLEARDQCRIALSPLTVELEYVDIYNRKMPTARRCLRWFGRHTAPA